MNRPKKDGESWVDDDGCSWDSPAEWVQLGVLKMCLCGSPDDNVEYVLGGLKRLAARSGCETRDDFARAIRDELGYFGSASSALFFWYWLEREGYSEHGSAVPGWLSPKGEALAEDIEWALKESEFE